MTARSPQGSGDPTVATKGRATAASWSALLACVTLLLAVGGALGSDAAGVDLRVRGNSDAPVTLIEYSDFTCGYCLKFFRETWPRIQAKYVETGKVRFVYRDYPRADQGPGLDAAVAARCAGDQGRYWAMHDRLFADGGRLDAATFDRHAKALGLDAASFSTCMRDGRHVDSIFHDRREGTRWGFRGTPGFVLMLTRDGRGGDAAVTIPGAFPYQVFEEEIERLLARTHPRGKSGA